VHADLILTIEDAPAAAPAASAATDEREEWRKLARSVSTYRIPGEHASFTTRNLPILGQILTECLKNSEARK
jgi:thioesterase domain-containing protein